MRREKDGRTSDERQAEIWLAGASMPEPLVPSEIGPRVHPQRLPAKTLDLLNLGQLAFQECYHNSEDAVRQDSPDYMELRVWCEAHVENLEWTRDAVRFVALRELPPSLARGLDIEPTSTDSVAWFLGFVVGNVRSAWRQIAPVLWFELVLWLTGLCRALDPPTCTSALRLSTSTRAALLEGFRQARERMGDTSLSSVCSGARKCVERVLGYRNLVHELGEKTSLLAPTFCARVWSMPAQARERFGVELQKLETPPSRSELRSMCQRALDDPEKPEQDTSAPTPEDELETLIGKAQKLIKAGCLGFMLVLLPLPPAADPYRLRSPDQRGCGGCTAKWVDPTVRLLARALESLRLQGGRLSLKMQNLIQSTLPGGP